MSRLGKVVIAAVVGLAAGVLLAPKSGKETREDLKKKAMHAKKYANEKAQKAKMAAKEAGKTIADGTEVVNVEANGMLRSAQQSRKVVTDEAEKLRSEARERAGRLAEEAKRTAHKVQKDAEKSMRES
jgi:gas vesicle protein